MTGHHLIVGGCGFIGRHVAVLLARAGHRVTLADRVQPTYKFPSDVASSISWQQIEVLSAGWDRLVGDASVVHHYAWTSIPASANENPLGDLTSNVTPTLELLEALRRRGGGRMVFASSGGTVYGKLQHVPVSEEHPLTPITAYGAGKVAAEVYLGLYRALHGIDCRIARISNPFGAGQDLTRGQGAATKFLHSALTNQPIVIWGDGNVVRDYIHISDVAKGIVALSLSSRLDEYYVFNIGSGCGVSLNTIVLELERRLGRALEVRREPGRPFDLPVSVLDISRARRVLGWEPQLSFSQGVASTMADLAQKEVFSTLDFPHARSASR